MNKKVKKSTGIGFVEEQGRTLEVKMKNKKNSIKTNKMYNKALKELDIEELTTLDDAEYDLFENRTRGKK